jgi:predicted lysophospholipase L1 biosynthesis ABC-type transport system permease subunit
MIFWKEYEVMWIVTASALWDLSAFSVSSKIYLPIQSYDDTINSSNARVEKKYFAWFYSEYNTEIVDRIKNDQIFNDFRIRSLDDRNENIGEITDRLEIFINFFNLIVFVLTFFIIILSLETFYKKLKQTLWLLTILGLSKSKMFFYNLIFIAFIFLVALLWAIIMNYLALIFLGSFYNFIVFYPSSIFQWILITSVLLIIGVYSPFYKIYTSRIRDLLSDSSFFSNFGFINYFVYLSLLFMWFYAISVISNIPVFESFLYSLWFTGTIIVLYIMSSIFLRLIYALIKNTLRKKNFYIFDALRSTIKPWNVSFFIVFSSFISFLSIFVFFVFSWSFLGFISSFTAASNDSFVVDVSPDDIEITRKYFSDDEIYTIIPMRIVEVNKLSFSDYTQQNNINIRQFSREYFSTTRNIESDILDGTAISSWWVSIDKEFAADLWITIWDQILFNSAWLEINLIVVNIRKAVRSGASPFFYFSVFSADFEKYPKRYFISYKSQDKAENIQFEYSQAVWGDVTFINAKEIIAIVLDVTNKVLLIIYFCLAYVTIFSFLTFLVSISFLKSFKNAKLSLMHILWGQKKKLSKSVIFEYIYLMFFGLSISVALWSLWLYLLGYYIEYFTIDIISFIQWLWLVIWLLCIMSLYLFVSQKKND